jgi:hypothetical protein
LEELYVVGEMHVHESILLTDPITDI